MAIIYRFKDVVTDATIDDTTGVVTSASGLPIGSYNVGKVEKYDTITEVVLATTDNDVIFTVD